MWLSNSVLCVCRCQCGPCEQMSISRGCLCCHEVGAISQKIQDSGNDVDFETMSAYRDIRIDSYSNNSICYHG